MKDFGLLYYDIPEKMTKLYWGVRKIIGKTCLPVNQSVYVFDWGLKSSIELKLQTLDPTNLANLSIVKFDNSSSSELENLAIKQLERIFGSIKSFIESEKFKVQDSDKKEKYLKAAKKKLDNYKGLVVLYEISNRISPAIDALGKVIEGAY